MRHLGLVIRYIEVSLYQVSKIYGRRKIDTPKFVRYIEVLTEICRIDIRYIGVLLY